MKADITDMSSGIIDINDIPDIATWSKKLQAKENASGIITNKDQLVVLASEIKKHSKEI
ncbi:MAG TPA: hypothetical protein VJ729_00645 [Nitrososphaeraceae archaeon]|jgi:hypothetical protein|nr:hypothetical protein [Nitrososphaeraceae archaeon]